MSEIEEGRVLSIQSHVVSGYVGNKSATFPLQVLGFEVDAINSVQFSNHTGYNYFKGQVLNACELDELIAGLKLNDIHNYTHLLTGYVGDPSFLQKVVDFAKELKIVNPQLIYVCDPVLGDNKQMYVPPSLLPIYQNEVIPLANIITPNLFEAELLSGITIKSEADAFNAMNVLHAKGPSTVVITSMPNDEDPNILTAFASSVCGDKWTRLKVKMPKIGVNFTGTGDLFSACFLAWMTKTKDLKISMEKSLATLQDVLKRTERIAKNAAGEGNKPTVAQLEMRLIQSKPDIEKPKSEVETIVLT